MNIILLEAEEINNQNVMLVDRRAEHIIRVLGAKVGDSYRVGVINGKIGTGTVLSITRNRPYGVELGVKLTAKVRPEPAIDLVLALPRPIMLKRIFSQAAALGVGRFYIIHARRVEKSFWSGSILKQDQARFQLLQGLEQAVDTRVPDVEMHRRFKPFAEDVLPLIKERYSHLLVAHPEAGSTLLQSMSGESVTRILFAIGPEGGWVDYEINKLCEQGFKSFTIGNRILKVDTAVVALHSRISQVKECLMQSSIV